MRRLARNLFTLCSALSMLLCIAVCVLWFRSYRMSEQINWRNAGGWRAIRTASGKLELALLSTDWSAYPQEFRAPRYERDVARPPFNYLILMGGNGDDVISDWEWRGFAWHENRNARLGSLHAEGFVPFWSVAAIPALLPLAWTILTLRSRIHRRRRKDAGFCPTCGYDLRATPDRCPGVRRRRNRPLVRRRGRFSGPVTPPPPASP